MLAAFMSACAPSPRESSNIDVDETPTGSTSSASTPAKAIPARPTHDVAGVRVAELSSYTKAGRTWRNLVIPADLEGDALVRLARELHKADPASSFRFFTDDSRFDEYMLWDQNYPDARYPSPSDWVRRHYVAMANLMLESGGARWQLIAMDGGMRLLPANAQSMTIADLD
jgi:hypothetical protein